MGLRGEQGAKGYEEGANTGEFWRCTLIESESRLRAARGIAKSETEAAIEAFKQLKSSRGHPHSPPPLVSDGWGGYDEAMVEVWGRCRSTEEGTASDQEAARGGLALPTDGQAARKWAGGRDQGEDHLRR